MADYKKTEKLLYNYRSLEVKIKNIALGIKGTEDKEAIEKLEAAKEQNESLKQQIDNALGILTEEERRLIRLRYFDNREWISIGHEICMDRVSCSRLRNRAINKISELIYS